MKTGKQTTKSQPQNSANSGSKKTQNKKGSSAGAAASMDMPAASSTVRARRGSKLPNEGTIHSYEDE